MNLYEPDSPKRTTLVQERDAFSVKAKASRAEVIRLSKQLYPQWQNETVKRATYVTSHSSPPLGVSYHSGASVNHTGFSEQDDSAQNQDLIRRTLAGEKFQSSLDIRAQLENEQRQLAAYESAIEHLSREIERESNRLRDEYAKSLESKHRDMMVKLSSAVVNVHAAFAEVQGLKRHLIDSGVNLRRGLCNTMPEFLGNPSDAYGDMAAFLTAAKLHGWIKAVPASLCTNGIK